MRYYVIGIGGTGAKCIEALAHLCAAGLMPKGELYALFVDPDRANGSLERAEITLQQYANCKQLQLGSTDLLKTEITISRPDVWSPFGNDPKPQLDDFFRYNTLKSTNEPAAHLFDVLYSPDEKSTPLEQGFRGHPSIGAAVMASTLELGGDEPWKTFRNRIAEDVKTGAGAKVILIGSIFGGTGASGLPTIARLIRDELRTAKAGGEKAKRNHDTAKLDPENARLGGMLILPYFSFDPVESETLRADAENFLLSTQAALKYYYQQDDLGIYDAVYLMGEQTLSPVKDSSIGGRTQRNEPHFIELCAGLACIDFYLSDERNEYVMVARHGSERLTWSDLPYRLGSDRLSDKIDQLARFAFAYLSSYYPMLENINTAARPFRAPWYIDFFEREKVDLSNAMKGQLIQLKEYCESFLRWLANIETSAKELDIQLINYNAFARIVTTGAKEAVELFPPAAFRIGEFANLSLPRSAADPHALTRLWEKMCDAKVNDNQAIGVGKFIHALYRECVEGALVR